jgi:hypothetical protein
MKARVGGARGYFKPRRLKYFLRFIKGKERERITFESHDLIRSCRVHR